MSREANRYIILCGVLLVLTSVVQSCRPKVAPASLGEVYLPDHLTSPQQKLSYLIDHYWDKMEAQPDTTQSLVIRQVEDFCALIHAAPLDKVQRSIIRPLNALSGSALQTALTTYTTQLYRPESKHYNEEFYRFILAWEKCSMKLDSARRVAAYLQEIRLRNNAVGHLAQDFVYHTSDTTGIVARRLSHFAAPYTLLILSVDSDTRNIQWGKAFQQSKSLVRMMKQHTLRPLVIYTGNTRPDSLQRSLWSGATLAYDSAQLIANQKRYDLSRGSTLYLLDAKKRVLLRNTTIPKVATYLHARDEE